MGLLSTIINTIFQGSELSRLGHPDLWREAKRKKDKEALEQYEKRFKQLLSDGKPYKRSYAGFLLATGRAKEGKRYLEESIVDKEEGAENNYVLALNYYFAHTGKAFADHQTDPWLKDLVNQAEKNVEMSIPNAHVELANVYADYFKVTDEGGKERLTKAEDMFEKAIKKSERLANYHYGDYLMFEAQSEGYKLLFPEKEKKWLEAKKYYLESLKKEQVDLVKLDGESKIFGSLVRYNCDRYQEIEKKIVKQFFDPNYDFYPSLEETKDCLSEGNHYLAKMKKVSNENNKMNLDFAETSIVDCKENNSFYAVLYEMKKKYPHFVENFFLSGPYCNLIYDYVTKRSVPKVKSIYYDYEIAQYYLDHKETIFEESGYEVSEDYLNRIDKLNEGQRTYLNSGNRIILD